MGILLSNEMLFLGVSSREVSGERRVYGLRKSGMGSGYVLMNLETSKKS